MFNYQSYLNVFFLYKSFKTRAQIGKHMASLRYSSQFFCHTHSTLNILFTKLCVYSICYLLNKVDLIGQISEVGKTNRIISPCLSVDSITIDQINSPLTRSATYVLGCCTCHDTAEINTYYPPRSLIPRTSPQRLAGLSSDMLSCLLSIII